MTTETKNYSLYYLKHPTTREIRYVGITNDPTQRYSAHRNASKNNKYSHYPVYRWWRKLAKQGLEPQMEILKTGLTREEAEQAEIETITLYRKLSNRMLNVTDGGNLTINSKHWNFIDLEGNPVEILNLKKFCKENGLSYSGMRRVHNGKLGSHHGWTASIEKRNEMLKGLRKTYKFIDPEGNPVEIFNLKKFCKENGLSYLNMRAVYSGERKSHHGWTISFKNREKMLKGPGKAYEFIDPDGETIQIFNLHKFCRENGLNQSAMCHVHIGKRKSHRGWTAANKGEK